MLRVSGQFTKEDYRLAYTLHYRPSSLGMAIRAVLLVIMALVWFFVVLDLPTYGASAVFVILFPGIALTYQWWLPFVHAQQVDRIPLLSEPFELTVDGYGISYRAKSSTWSVSWETFERSKWSADLILLYLAKYQFRFFPRRVFTSDREWELFLELVRSKTPVEAKS